MPRKAKAAAVEETTTPMITETDEGAPVPTPKAAKPKPKAEKKTKAEVTDAPVPTIAKKASRSKKAAAEESAPVKKQRKRKAAVDESSGPREKRPLNAYFLFKDEVRSAVVAAHPEAKALEIGSLIGERYRALPEQEKARFIKRAGELSAAYKARQAVHGVLSG